ncbi:hypothetical protein [Agromyces larvae]|uniref:Uncharacterized protein n=1 Tax=Agromyces larvae TaxID=2929802 RepID=A0ABY4C646_9MICO|nr:hypothetical protein [Agromyces larvae]UOE45463.1 hypothetical protein MTO99_06820 [Agromyces larvae]
MPIKRIWAATVWAKHSGSTHDWRFRGILTWVLPATDALFLAFGLIGWAVGVQTVVAITGHAWQGWWSLGVALAAGIALVGSVFPALWWLELAGKVPLVGLLTVYVAALAVRGVPTALLVIVLQLLPLWRVLDLSGAVLWLKSRGRL